jgi:5,5'-dehydrodivanillate O-demethylase
MLTTELNERYTRVGPGTPCGELMRRYWHPIAAVSQMKDRWTLPIKLLCEDLVLYKDRSGTFGLMEPRCPHRRMGMIYGIPEAHGLRCPYHGWLFDETGQCLEQPYEQAEDPESTYKDRVRAQTYPVQEMAGLLFAYLGPQPAPLLPRWDVYAMEGMVRDIGYANLPCNWLQCQENSLDPVHVEWLHNVWADYVLEQTGRGDKRKPQKKHVKIGFDVFEYGIIKRRVVEGGSEEDTPWRDGHPVVFPYFLRQGGSGFYEDKDDQRGPAFQIRVPLDDTHTGHWWVECFPRKEGEPEQRPEDVPYFTVPVVDVDEFGLPRWDLLESNSAQDVAAWITQGDIANRGTENLGRSDKGIIMFRRMLEQNMRIVEDGGDPMNTFRDPAENVYHAMRTERRHERNANFANTPFERQGAATKYSPILNQRGAPHGVPTS